MSASSKGLISAIAAFTLWGVLPLYWKQVDFMASPSIVAHRTIWSLVILGTILLWRREGAALIRQLKSPAAAGWLLISGALLAANWILYVWATLNERIIEGSLGYYLNPFFNMLFGMIWFGERHNRMQGVAIALALCGVVIQLPAAGTFPWVAFTLAVTFSLYAVVKKRGSTGSRAGLTAESALLAPIAIGWLCWQSSSPAAAFGGSWVHALWLIGAGLATTAPLLCFGYAARNIRLTTLGMVQFIGPTIQLIIGWQIYDEPMPLARVLSFGLIWAAIALYTMDALRRRPV
ncbi:MAG: EamA family transporter RarD [Akkermansiaceae bacterium]|nr:EamA family transporter RarD [Akkermansiaceae bacterium]